MNTKFFDELTVSLGTAKTRRSVARVLAGGAAAGALARLGVQAAAACTPLGKKCAHSQDCCFGGCKGHKCRCSAGNKPCNGRCIPVDQCCNGCPSGQVCQGGTCVGEPRQTVEVATNMKIVDHDNWPGSDDICSPLKDSRKVTLTAANPRASFDSIVETCDVQRVDFDLDAELLDSGHIRVTGIAHLSTNGSFADQVEIGPIDAASGVPAQVPFKLGAPDGNRAEGTVTVRTSNA
ncbi:MAG TPA: hypothetical protein VFU72_06865 [Nitrolancea sp.]|nr:hypothetical protein [Nitrolancea sp.]